MDKNSTPVIRDRHLIMLELLPKYNFAVKPAAIEAGFTEKTADKQGKSLLQTALKKQAKLLEQRQIALKDNKDMTTSEMTSVLKQTMAERIGLTREDVMNNIKYLVEQERDLATRLKVIKALAKEYQVDLGEEESEKTIVPMINVTVKERNTLNPSHIIEHPPLE